ncbi:hypothetical protein CN317_23890 [Bacillus cereus]|nr:hypothetical protein CN317_23890 [Bacillus cereus]
MLRDLNLNVDSIRTSWNVISLTHVLLKLYIEILRIYEHRQAFACRNIQESKGVPHLVNGFLDIPMLESVRKGEKNESAR